MNLSGARSHVLRKLEQKIPATIWPSRNKYITRNHYINFFFCFVAELSNAQRTFSKSLQGFSFECIGDSQTDDEVIISSSLREFGKLIAAIEEERDRMVSPTF